MGVSTDQRWFVDPSMRIAPPDFSGAAPCPVDVITIRNFEKEL